MIVVFQETAKPQEVDEIMKALDHDGDGKIDITEYMVTLCSLGILLDEATQKKHCPKK